MKFSDNPNIMFDKVPNIQVVRYINVMERILKEKQLLWQTYFGIQKIL